MPPLTVLEPETESRERLAPRWSVVLLDDDDHSYEYVIEMLGALFGHSRDKAFEMATEVDAAGRAVVWTGHRSKAERKQRQIHAYGADPRLARSQGSMTAVLEPVE